MARKPEAEVDNEMQERDPTPRLVTYAQARARTSLGRTTMYRLTIEGKFPRPVDVGKNRKAFVESEIDQWILARIAARNTEVV